MLLKKITRLFPHFVGQYVANIRLNEVREILSCAMIGVGFFDSLNSCPRLFDRTSVVEFPEI